ACFGVLEAWGLVSLCKARSLSFTPLTFFVLGLGFDFEPIELNLMTFEVKCCNAMISLWISMNDLDSYGFAMDKVF
ncbi:hypothetical protein, partial [Alteromonas stellipolaris]|uniref:hypothetical protein n=1 Tax=Alteromonas stellipolaris TaxID=233316 RepID=UPI001E08FB16